MFIGVKKLLFQTTFCFFSISFTGIAQDSVVLQSATVEIRDIHIAGNKKTKLFIVLRELGFQKGASVKTTELETVLLKAKQQLINTSLFLFVNITKEAVSDSAIKVLIALKERWYIFPSPVFSLADKNFNLWWNQQRRSLERVSYGIALDYNNVTGHNDNFTFGYQTGYNPSGTVFYKRPNLGRKQQHEVGFLFHRGKAREVNHITIADRKTFLSLQSFARFQTELKLFYSLRKNIYTRHNFTLAFTNEKVDDSVAKVNPNFLGNGQSRIFFPSVIYRFQFNNANNLLYPLKGKSVSAEFLHHGAGKKYGVNTTQLKIDANLYLPIGKGFYFTTGFLGKFFLPRRPAFLFTRGLGYDDRESFRGFDAFALDGNAYGVLKANVIKRLFSTTLNINFLPSTFRKIPFEFYLKGLMDGGYVVNPVPGNNVLVNRWLLNRGLSLDIVTFYDINISFEYNFNKYIGQGLFFRSKFGLF